MHIDIALRFKPFSHQPGTICLVPGTHWRVQIFPTLVHFFGPDGQHHQEKIVIEGPVEGFTIEQDLEQGKLRVFGHTKQGFLSYSIAAVQETVEMVIEKGEKRTIRIGPANSSLPPTERLSLGNHKKQEWEGIRRRLDLREILPHWLRLGQMTPASKQDSEPKGSLLLLEECLALYKKRDRCQLETRLCHLFMAGFDSLLSPRLRDSDHQGIISDHPDEDSIVSLQLLTDGADLIRRLFFFEEENVWHVLSCLLPRFDAGRFVQIKTHGGDVIDLEWSKRALRRMIIRPKADRSIDIIFPKELQRCRLRHHLKEKGRILQAGDSLVLNAGKIVFLDCFQK